MVILGVARSGTRLLKAILDAHPELALPNESFFLPALWTRHGATVRTRRFADDLRRIELARGRDTSWTEEDLAELGRLAPACPFATAVDAFYRAHADRHGARRYGNKTPDYIHHLDLMERAFPAAQYVHIVRDGRDAALSWGSMPDRGSRWRWPGGILDFACEWRDGVGGARRFGRGLGSARYTEVRYEDLVAAPEEQVRRVCEFLGLRFEPGMLDYWRRIPRADAFPNHPRLVEPPGPPTRDWRTDMPAPVAERFEAIAAPVLAENGYDRRHPSPSGSARAAAAAAAALSRLRRHSWRGTAWLWRKGPAWRFRPV